MSWLKGNDSTFEKITKQTKSEADRDRKITQKDRTTSRKTSRNGKQWTRNIG